LPSNAANKHSPSYRLAMLDADFLLGESQRGARLMLEYEKAEHILKDHGVMSTIVCFGSARARDGGSRLIDRAYAEARRFGRLASERGGAVNGKRGAHYNVIATGGGPGLMEAANRGALDAGAINIGYNIVLPHEQEPNPYSSPELTFNFHYFAVRKFHLAMRAAGLVVFPGGFGTLDELFEIITLQQTTKMHRCPVVLFNKGFWTRLINLDLLVAEGLIAPADTGLFRYAETAEEVWEQLLAGGLKPYEPPPPPLPATPG
jgi:uncharacterized protein (TIGR00730 family)